MRRSVIGANLAVQLPKALTSASLPQLAPSGHVQKATFFEHIALNVLRKSSFLDKSLKT